MPTYKEKERSMMDHPSSSSRNDGEDNNGKGPPINSDNSNENDHKEEKDDHHGITLPSMTSSSLRGTLLLYGQNQGKQQQHRKGLPWVIQEEEDGEEEESQSHLSRSSSSSLRWMDGKTTTTTVTPQPPLATTTITTTEASTGQPYHLHPSDRNEEALMGDSATGTLTTTTPAKTAITARARSEPIGRSHLLRKIRDSHSVRRHEERRKNLFWENHHDHGGGPFGMLRRRRPTSSSLLSSSSSPSLLPWSSTSSSRLWTMSKNDDQEYVDEEDDEEDENDDDDDENDDDYNGDTSFLRVASGGIDDGVVIVDKKNYDIADSVDEETPLTTTTKKKTTSYVDDSNDDDIIGGGRRRPRRVSFETYDTIPNVYGTVGRTTGINKTKDSDNNRKRVTGRGWAIVREHLKRGSFLLEDVLAGAQQCGVVDMNNNNGGINETLSRNDRVKSAASLRHEMIEAFQKGSTFSSRGAITAIIIYLALSVLSFHFFFEPSWSIIDCCYFAVTTFTTNGYGDLSPSTTIGEIFTTFYALAGVACLGIAIGVLGNKLLQSHEDRTWLSYDTKASSSSSSSDDDYDYDYTTEMSNVEYNRNLYRKQHNAQQHDHQHHHYHLHQVGNAGKANNGICRRQSAYTIDKHTRPGSHADFNFIRFLLLVTATLAFAYAIGFDSGWNFWNVLYYTVVTGCTIGYGDLAPQTQNQRFLAIIFIPLSCAVTGHCLAYFATYVLERQSAMYRKLNFAAHSELTVEDLRTMDITGDGKVAWYEFLEFMLIATRKVDPDFLDELRDYFDRLDVTDTGELSQDSLIECARRKLNHPRRKLELSFYKARLLEISRRQHRRMKMRQLKQYRSTPSLQGRPRRFSSPVFPRLSLRDWNTNVDFDDDMDGNHGNFGGPFPGIRHFLSVRQ